MNITDIQITEQVLRKSKEDMFALEFKRKFFKALNVNDYRQIIGTFDSFLEEKSLQTFFGEYQGEVNDFKSIIKTLKLGYTDISSENFAISFNLLKLEPINFYNTLITTQPTYKNYDFELFRYSDLHNHLIPALLNDVILSGRVTKFNLDSLDNVSNRFNVSLIGKILSQSPQKTFDVKNLFQGDHEKIVNASSVNTLMVELSKKGADTLIVTNNLVDNLQTMTIDRQQGLLSAIMDAHNLFEKSAFVATQNNELKNASKIINKRYDNSEDLKGKTNLFRAVSGLYLIMNNFDLIKNNQLLINKITEDIDHFNIPDLSEKNKNILSSTISNLLQEKNYKQEVVDFISNLKSSPLNTIRQKLKI